MATPRRKVGNISLPRPLRKPREQVSLDLNQNVLETSSSRSASKSSCLVQEAEDKTAHKKSSIENLNLVECESPLGRKDNYSKSDDGLSNHSDEKSGHVKYKGSLRPDGTRRKDRKIKSEKYVNPFRRDQKVDENTGSSIENLNLKKRESPEGSEEPHDESSSRESPEGGEETHDESSSPVPESFYDKKKSFFDSISCEATEKSKSGSRPRQDRNAEFELNKETFGVAGNRGGHRGYNNYNIGGGYRGKQGQGGQYRGGRGGGQYRGGYQNNRGGGESGYGGGRGGGGYGRGGYNNQNDGGYNGFNGKFTRDGNNFRGDRGRGGYDQQRGQRAGGEGGRGNWRNQEN